MGTGLIEEQLGYLNNNLRKINSSLEKIASKEKEQLPNSAALAEEIRKNLPCVGCTVGGKGCKECVIKVASALPSGKQQTQPAIKDLGAIEIKDGMDD